MDSDNVNDEANTDVNDTLPSQAPRLTDAEMLQFTYEGMLPVEGNADGSYEPFHWREKKWVQKWKDILEYDNTDDMLPLPPLLLSEKIAPKVVLVLHLERCEGQIWVRGGFHLEVSHDVLPFNVELQLSLELRKVNYKRWRVTKQIVATLTSDDLCLWPILTIYDIPFGSFSSAPPQAAISIKRISPEQQWFYYGLAPRFGKEEFPTIVCRSLHGANDFAREWKMTVEHPEKGHPVYLPPMVTNTGDLEDVAVCMRGERQENELWFLVRYHSATDVSIVDEHTLLIKITLHLNALDNKGAFIRQVENIVIVDNFWSDPIIFRDIPWSLLSPCPPVIDICIINASQRALTIFTGFTHD